MNTSPVVMITGASGGIGAATASLFARKGYRCLLLAPDGEGLHKTAATVTEAGAEVLLCPGDLCDLAYAKASVDQAVERWGRIDVLINNAAWREIVTMKQISQESWEQTLKVCLTAPAFLAKWCAAAMQDRRRGVILNISSIQSKFVAGISPAYVAAKGGLDALTYELATLYGPVGIRVLSLNLGAIDTELSRDYVSAEGENLSEQLRHFVEDMIPLKRYAQPEEIARCLFLFASDEASYLTGTCVEVDGGWFHQCSPYRFKQAQFPDDFASR